jgi:hypothetical protein
MLADLLSKSLLTGRWRTVCIGDSDLVLQEDEAPWCDGRAPSHFALARTIAVNLFRLNGLASLTQGIRHLAHDVHRLFSFFQ